MSNIVLFQEKNVRRIRFQGEWWFVIKDVVSILTNSNDPSQYLKRLRSRDMDLNNVFKGEVQFVPPLGLEFETKGGRQLLQCWNTMGILRLIQSIPSKNAEPFKRWLAKVGKERIDEIEDPELAQERMKIIYESKGYSKDWIDKRIRGIVVRQNLTDEWKKRGVNSQNDFSILTAEISKATFGMTPGEYKKFKGLDNENLRDHMDDLELIFSMLGERVSTEITQQEDARDYSEVENAAKRGGRAAGNARKETEKELGRPVSNSDNFISQKKKKIIR